ncbi:MAG TPA: AAA family ATPase [Blastocatellia bacterium]|nr:AAA family ATPase [Blastocatellia bacterium]
MNNIGLCGAHRTGKTTLAMELARLTGKQFVRTRVTEIFKQHGLHAAQEMDFETRLGIQYRILEACESDWQQAAGDFVTDRTPIDFLAYTLGDVQGKTEVHQADFDHYIERCFDLTKSFFDTLVILQPGIPLAEAEGKAALNKAYIEHINSLVIGLCHDQRVHNKVVTLNREVIELDERIRLVTAAL